MATKKTGGAHLVTQSFSFFFLLFLQLHLLLKCEDRRNLKTEIAGRVYLLTYIYFSAKS